MSDFIQRLQKLDETRKGYVDEKNRLEATIAIQEDSLKEIRNELQQKGISYDSIEELEADIKEREEYLDSKIKTLENIALNTSVPQTEAPKVVAEKPTSVEDPFATDNSMLNIQPKQKTSMSDSFQFDIGEIDF